MLLALVEFVLSDTFVDLSEWCLRDKDSNDKG